MNRFEEAAMRSFAGAVVAWLASFALIPAGSGADIDAACVEQVMSAGRASWQKTLERTRDIEVVCHEKSSVKDFTSKNPVVNTPSDWKICWSTAKNRRLVDRIYPDDAKRAIHVGNSDYGFTVSVNGNLRPEYQLLSASPKEKGSEFPSHDPAEQLALEQILGASYYVAGLSLQDLMRDQVNRKLAVARFLPQAASADRLVRLEWECVTDQGNMARIGTRYWVELDPISWLIVRCGLNNPNGGSYLKSVEYQTYEGVPFPKVVNATFTRPQIMAQIENYQYETPHSCTLNDAEFYLPYYGIPESVVDITRASSWVRTAAIVLSLIGVAVSVYLYRQSLKPSDPKTAPG